MKRRAILAFDIIAAIVAVLWFRAGRWLDLYGFSGRHPQSALDYFQGFVAAGSALFASIFIMLSLILFLSDAREERGNQRLLAGAFYGNGQALLTKYSAFFLSAVGSPVLYFYLWRANLSRSGRVARGFLLESILFFLVLILAEWLVARPAPAARTETSRPTDAERAPA